MYLNATNNIRKKTFKKTAPTSLSLKKKVNYNMNDGTLKYFCNH